MNHPWDDGTVTDKELKEMVDFCREEFCKHRVAFTTDRRAQDIGPRRSWEWKKGDWFWFDGINIISHIKGDGIYSRNEKGELQVTDLQFGNKLIPLPLAHQWMKLLPEECQITTHYHRTTGTEPHVTIDLRGDWRFGHANIHYTCYRAFRAVVERE